MSVYSSSLYSHDAGIAVAESEEAPPVDSITGIEECNAPGPITESQLVQLPTAHAQNNSPNSSVSRRIGSWAAIAIGVTVAMLVASAGKSRPQPTRFARQYELKDRFVSTQSMNALDSHQLDRLAPQTQAETLLQLAATRSDGALEQISSRVERWRGNVKWTPQMATLGTAALNSPDMRVRQAGIEVELAAYGLGKNEASLNSVLRAVDSSDYAQKLWALWALGLLGNRAMQRDRVSHVLTTHLADRDEESRYWAAEGLAMAASDQAIASLLTAMHDDPSPRVREAAAGGLAESGMFTPTQRFRAVPQLLNYIDDAALDEQTHAWAFQALADITRQELPDDAAAWRRWYKNQGQGLRD